MAFLRVSTFLIVVGRALAVSWGSDGAHERCEDAVRETIAEDRATAADETASRLHSTWLSQECEVRAGPEYVIRKYTFYQNGTFLLHRHHYAEESCSVATHTLTARGALRLLQPSLTISGATEARYQLHTVHIIPLNRQVAYKFGHRVNASCSPQPRWRPYVAQLIYDLPLRRFSGPFWEGPRYNSLQGHPYSRNHRGLDCLEPLGVDFEELRLLRVQRKPPISKAFGLGVIGRPRVELLLGSLPPNVHSRRTHRPSSLQPTSLLRIDNINGCPVCSTIARGTETSPPLLHEAAALPALLGGSWLSSSCESFEGGFWMRRQLQIYSGDKLWTGRWDYYEDPKCTSFLYAISAAGSYVQRAGRQRRHPLQYNFDEPTVVRDFDPGIMSLLLPTDGEFFKESFRERRSIDREKWRSKELHDYQNFKKILGIRDVDDGDRSLEGIIGGMKLEARKNMKLGLKDELEDKVDFRISENEKFEEMDTEEFPRMKKELAEWMTPELAKKIFDMYGPKKVRTEEMLPTLEEIREAIGKSDELSEMRQKIDDEEMTELQNHILRDSKLLASKMTSTSSSTIPLEGTTWESSQITEVWNGRDEGNDFSTSTILPQETTESLLPIPDEQVGDNLDNMKDKKFGLISEAPESTTIPEKEVNPSEQNQSSLPLTTRQPTPVEPSSVISISKKDNTENEENKVRFVLEARSSSVKMSQTKRRNILPEKTEGQIDENLEVGKARRSLDEDSYRHLLQNAQPSMVESFAAMLRGNQRYEQTTKRPLVPPMPSGTTELDLHVAESLLIPGDPAMAQRCGSQGEVLTSWPRNCVRHAIEAPSTLGLRARIGVNWVGHYILMLGPRDDNLWQAPLRQCGPTLSYNPRLRAHLRRMVGLKFGLVSTSGAGESFSWLIVLQVVVCWLCWLAR
ncbi:uncharacterized protein LOC105694984 [Orussus abietinus]|uniref:uncharacterized protein LOC105694984 n=1 Tax=Orussus abietinus TaxID=222816 RepID=UPI0006250116|nr:uncharacterized protein LOC105694984 [Orussus abietinus]